MITINATIYTDNNESLSTVVPNHINIKKNDDICMNITIVNNSLSTITAPCFEFKDDENFKLIHNSMLYTKSKCPIPCKYDISSKFILDDIGLNSSIKLTFFMKAILKTITVDNLNTPISINNLYFNNKKIDTMTPTPLLSVKESIISIELNSKTIYMKNIGNKDIQNLIFTYKSNDSNLINAENITMTYGKNDFKDFSVKSMDNNLVFNIHHLSKDKDATLLINLENNHSLNKKQKYISLNSIKLN